MPAPQSGGKERDVESQYDYFGTRCYDSRIGGWLAVDPSAAKTPGWTPYRFGFDNPLRFYNPSGRLKGVKTLARQMYSGPMFINPPSSTRCSSRKQAPVIRPDNTPAARRWRELRQDRKDLPLEGIRRSMRLSWSPSQPRPPQRSCKVLPDTIPRVVTAQGNHLQNLRRRHWATKYPIQNSTPITA
jgi:RHS repeat-associated protein